MAKKAPTYSRWSPLDPTGATSLLDQLARALLKGQPSTDPTKPPTVTAEIPTHAANFLLHAIYQIKTGVTADDALGLTNRKGRPKNKYRDALLAVRVNDLKKAGMTSEEAIAEAGSTYCISEDAAKTAYKNGAEDAEFVAELRSEYGDDVANEHINHLTERLSRGTK